VQNIAPHCDGSGHTRSGHEVVVLLDEHAFGPRLDADSHAQLARQ
jgi:hypothetical protein